MEKIQKKKKSWKKMRKEKLLEKLQEMAEEYLTEAGAELLTELLPSLPGEAARLLAELLLDACLFGLPVTLFLRRLAFSRAAVIILALKRCRSTSSDPSSGPGRGARRD